MYRRLRLPIVAFLLALLLGAGAASPAPGLWECRHAARLVAAPAAGTQAMPCLMGERMTRAAMACCRAKAAANTRGTMPTLSAPGCHPLFSPAAVFAVASLGQNAPSIDDSSAAPAMLADTVGVASVFTTTVQRQRPPPGDSPTASRSVHTSGPRAPPTA